MPTLGAVGALLAAVALAPASLPVAAGTTRAFVGTGIEDRLRTDGRVRVLVLRDVDGTDRPGPSTGVLESVRSLSGGRLLTGWLTPGGLEALEHDARTRAVVLDRLVRPAGQIGAAQIGSDRLLGAGVTGAGRSIGIVDTGIDLYHPDLGATASGSGRILGGWNFADGNADIYDCDGHGSAVAGVAAGVQGIAPEASIVALKVFGARDGCSGAWASDVLAAVDWAVEHRAELRIDVLNLSLADERARPGFCDDEDPVSAQLFARARAEGVAVVAASGNSGQRDGLSWPACHSDVFSVGMVYSVGQGPTSWNGDAQCTDPVTGPDLVPCSSNAGPALSVLAPGVRWLVPAAGGGRRTTFSGTSAAAPAAAGSLLLSRQFTLFRDPALSADFLRLTGVPVVDTRTGASTPRIDVGAAFVAASPFSGPCTRTEDVDASPPATVCRAEISSIVGRVTSLAVALSVEHPRLSGLRATLTDPNGTTVRLVDGPGRTGTVFREVIGRSVESAEPLSLFAGSPSEGTWTLRLEDDAGLAGGRLTSWALLVEPEAPRPADPDRTFSQLLPTVTRNAGLFGSFFSTDVVLFNPDSTPANVTLSFFPSGAPADHALSVDLRIPPRATRVLGDVVGNAFRTPGFGPVHVAAPTGVVVASRTETTIAGGGAYGLLAGSVDPSSAIGLRDAPSWLAPVFREGSSRVNVGFIEVDGHPVSVELLVRDASGSVTGRLVVELDPYGSRQVTDVHRVASVPASSEDLFEIRVLSGEGRVVAWAAAVDNGSNDGLLVVASKPQRSAFVPTTARSPGLFGAFFRTDLKLSNPWRGPVNVRVSFFPSKGSAPSQVVLSLGAWETRVFEDVLESLMGVEEDSAGALRLQALGSAPGIIASSRTFTDGPGWSYGLAIGPVENAQAFAGERIALTFLSSSPDTRTNLGMLETMGIETAVQVTLFDARGTSLAIREQSLAPNQAVQWNDVFAAMGVAPEENASAIVEVLGGGGVIAHAIRVDNRTNDASFLPGQVLRPPLPPR